jgi:hypothetical protein
MQNILDFGSPQSKSLAFRPRPYAPDQNPLDLIGFLVVGPAGSPPLACIRGLPHNRYMTQCISALDIEETAPIIKPLFDARGVTRPIFAAGYALALLDVAQTRWYLIIKSPLTQGGVTGLGLCCGVCITSANHITHFCLRLQTLPISLFSKFKT